MRPSSYGGRRAERAGFSLSFCAAQVTYDSGPQDLVIGPAHGGLLMLVLTRRLGEQIRIGDNILITVIEIDRGKVRLGLEAPPNVSIFRKELLNEERGSQPDKGST